MNKIYGITVNVSEHCWYGVIPEGIRPDWLDEIKGTRYFRSKRERDLFVDKIEELLYKTHGGYDEDGDYEITNYGTFSIVISYENYFEEEFKPVSERRVKVRARRA